MPGRAEATPAVVIPAYQAAATVGYVVAGVRSAIPAAPIYVIDDGCTDGTTEGGRVAGATVLRHGANLGKGAALASGITRALADGASVIVTLDADGQHAPELIPTLVAPLADGRADLVLGARVRTREMPLGRRFSNWLSAELASRVSDQPVPDAQTGFRAFSSRLATAVRPTERYYDYETAFLLGALAAGFRVWSVPIPTTYRGAPSHFHPWVDTWRLARVFARYGPHILAGGR